MVDRARRTGYEGSTCGSRTRREDDEVAAAARSDIFQGDGMVRAARRQGQGD